MGVNGEDSQENVPLTPEQIRRLKDEGWLSRKGLAEQRGVTVRAVAKWEELGFLTPHKLDGRTIYYDPTELVELPRKLRRRGRPSVSEEMGDMSDDIDSLGDAEDDPEDDTSAPAMGVKQALGHFAMAPGQIIKHVTAAMRQSQLALNGMMGSVNSMMSSLIDRSNEENERLRKRCSKLEDKNWTMLEAFQAMLDNKHAQTVREREAAQRTAIVRETAGKVADLAPLFVSFLGDKFDPQNPALKEAALSHIVGKLDEEQLQQLIQTGVFDATDMTTILSVKERLMKAEEERLKKRAEAGSEFEEKEEGPA